MQQKQQIDSRMEKPQVVGVELQWLAKLIRCRLIGLIFSTAPRHGGLFSRSKTKSPAAKEAPGAIRHSEF